MVKVDDSDMLSRIAETSTLLDLLDGIGFIYMSDHFKKWVTLTTMEKRITIQTAVVLAKTGSFIHNKSYVNNAGRFFTPVTIEQDTNAAM